MTPQGQAYYRTAFRDQGAPLGASDGHCRHRHITRGSCDRCRKRIAKGALASWVEIVAGQARRAA